MPESFNTKFRFLFLFLLIIFAATFYLPKINQKTIANKPSLNLIPEEKKASHFVSSFPKHNQFLVVAPTYLVLNFDKSFSKFSASVNININDNIISTQALSENSNKTVRQFIKKTSENGVYKVKYSLCFNQNECSEGQFAYKIDSSHLTQFGNLTSKTEVDIAIDENGVNPDNLLISAGTKVNWINHSKNVVGVKSEPEIFNNYLPSLNTESIDPGKTFSLEFKEPGEYHYFLKDNSNIKGKILVQ